MNALSGVLLFLTDPVIILYLAIFVFLGIYVGAIPGLSVTMAASLLISFTFSWDPLSALAAIIGVQIGGVYGGSRSAILLNIPGTPAAVATALDGYSLAQKGFASQAFGVTIIQSVLGGFIGTIILAIGAPIISEFSLKFAPRDYFLLGIMGLLLIGSLGSESTARGIFSALVGLFIGVIGLDIVTGQQRFTFGNVYLMGGIHYVVVMLGLFGMSEALFQLRNLDVLPVKQKVDKIRPDFKSIKKYIPLTIRSSLLGTFVGALPGTGGDIAALMAYDQARRTTKNPEVPFGQGAIEGLVAPESANNAAIGGAYIPMLTLGIPGDAVTAIVLGAMFIHGFRPGPLFMTESPHIFGFMVAGNIIGNIFLLIFGFMGIKLTVKIVEIPKHILMPIIIVLSVVGAYAINNSVADIYYMMGFGIFGYFLKLYHFPSAPMILGVILSQLVEQNYRRGVSMVGNNLIAFIIDLFANPISIVLIIMIGLMLITQSKFWINFREKREKAKDIKISE